MQLILDIEKQQDLQVLLPLLERLKIAYRQVPGKTKDKVGATPGSAKLSQKYAGKLSVEVGESLQQQIAESRNEWERTT